MLVASSSQGANHGDGYRRPRPMSHHKADYSITMSIDLNCDKFLDFSTFAFGFCIKAELIKLETILVEQWKRGDFSYRQEEYAEVAKKMDVFALGQTLCYALTGKLHWEADKEKEVSRNSSEKIGALDDLRALCSKRKLPKAVVTLIEGMVNIDYKSRFSMEEVNNYYASAFSPVSNNNRYSFIRA